MSVVFAVKGDEINFKKLVVCELLELWFTRNTLQHCWQLRPVSKHTIQFISEISLFIFIRVIICEWVFHKIPLSKTLYSILEFRSIIICRRMFLFFKQSSFFSVNCSVKKTPSRNLSYNNKNVWSLQFLFFYTLLSENFKAS